MRPAAAAEVDSGGIRSAGVGPAGIQSVAAAGSEDTRPAAGVDLDIQPAGEVGSGHTSADRHQPSGFGKTDARSRSAASTYMATRLQGGMRRLVGSVWGYGHWTESYQCCTGSPEPELGAWVPVRQKGSGSVSPSEQWPATLMRRLWWYWRFVAVDVLDTARQL